MKFKTTKKAMMEGQYIILSVGYCGLQDLLYYHQPTAYSAGRDGWSCDYYIINGVCISTGYKPVANKNVNITYELINDFEDRAKKIRQDYSMEWEVRRDMVNVLLNEFIEVVKGGK